jgi:hypothetical protein
MKEFMHLYWLQKNPQSSLVYNFQTKRGKFIQINSQFSSNPKWKNKYFFVSGQWEVTPMEKAERPRVPQDICDPSAEAYNEPILTPEMIQRVNSVIKWGREHPKMMFVRTLITSPRLSEFVYDIESFRPPRRPVSDPLRARLDPSSPAANTRASVPQKGKDQAPLAAQVKPKVVDKGKAKVVDTGKPEKVKYPIMTDGNFKIREPKVPTPPTLPIAPPMKRDSLREKVEKPSEAAWVLKLLDEEEGSEASGAVKDQPQPTPQIQVAIEESVEVIETPPVKKRKLTKTARTEVPAAGMAAPIIEVMDVAGFLASRRKKVVLPSVPPLAEVEKFMANEPVLAVPVAVAQMVKEESLRVPEGSIPTLSHPLGSNIRHILEEIDIMSEDSVGMADDNMEAPPKVVAGTL